MELEIPAFVELLMKQIEDIPDRDRLDGTFKPVGIFHLLDIEVNDVRCDAEIDIDIITADRRQLNVDDVRNDGRPIDRVRINFSLNSTHSFMNRHCHSHHIYFRRMYFSFIRKEELTAMVTEWSNDLAKIIFDYGTCVFYKKENEGKMLMDTALRNVVSSIKSIKMNGDEKCCVCFNITKVKSKCNHAICIPCVDTIIRTQRKNEDDEEEDGQVNCPICREPNLEYITSVRIPCETCYKAVWLDENGIQ